ncbi:MAG: CvpA family protein [Ruminiclostridium sp.]|jgi:uncharacterized membrane protein required for colicin V production|nr:CvpA family protein [Ruminiclostridium sp.]
MTMTLSLLLDLAVLIILLYCVITGVRRGFVLTLCSLIAVLVALSGGWYLSTHYAYLLQEKLEPVLVEKLLSTQESGQAGSNQDTASLLENYPQSIREHLSSQVENFQAATAQEIAASLASLLSQSICFLLGFACILLLWNILSHALNLVAKLPVLRQLNHMLGGIAGLLKGILILLVARWALYDLLGWIPADVVQESYFLPLLTVPPFFSLF